MRSCVIIIFCFVSVLQTVVSFQGFSLPKFSDIFQPAILNGPTSSNRKEQQESMLLETISNTQNGKTASPSQQREILRQVSALETTFPSPPLKDILSDINGEWYLQYTSPSEIEGDDDDDDSTTAAWAVENAEDYITTKKFKAQGSVSFTGVEVDVTNKPPKQIFNSIERSIFNEVFLEKAYVKVGGPFVISDKNNQRAVISLTECIIDLKFVKLDLAFFFAALSFLRGTDQLGWLETTYASDSVRIGRGNRGSMFILTREEGAVLP
mmetsp:Transcript_22117/g.33427  ORF Transcript_22117/g.33427 Transcript_22117/m.33427 type:complete len:267 (+) Transcript_22117:147-947(+)